MLLTFVYGNSMCAQNVIDLSESDKIFMDSLKIVLNDGSINDTLRVQSCISLGEKYAKYSLDSLKSKSLLAARMADNFLLNEKSPLEKYALKKLKAVSYNNAGVASYNMGDIDESLSLFKESLKIKESIKDEKGVSKSYNNIATIYNSNGNIIKALEYYYESLAIKEKLDDKKGAARTLNNIASIYSEQGLYSDALIHFKKSEKISLELKDTVNLSLVMNSVGGVYNEKATNFIEEGKLDSAFVYRVKAMDNYERSKLLRGLTGDFSGVANCLNNIATTQIFFAEYYSLIDQTDTINFLRNEAIKNYEKSLEIYLELNHAKGISNNYYNLGNTYFDLGKFIKSKENAVKSYQISKESGFPDELSVSALLLGKISIEMSKQNQLSQNEKMQMLLESSDYFQLHLHLNDSLYNEDNIKGLLQYQLQYSFDKKALVDSLKALKTLTLKDEQIAEGESERKSERTQKFLLFGVLILVGALALIAFNRFRVSQKRKIIIEQQKEEVEKSKNEVENSLKEREALLTEIHHRVKNNLQVISSLLSLQLSTSHNSSVEELVKTSQERIKSIALIHERLYSAKEFNQMDAAEYITMLCKDFEMAYGLKEKHIIIEQDVNDVYLDLTTSAPCGIILNELITNAIKYAFEENGGVIKIYGYSNADHNVLVIHDNGKGLPEGFDTNLSKSVGMRLSKGLAKQIKGTLEMSNENGAKITLKFRK